MAVTSPPPQTHTPTRDTWHCVTGARARLTDPDGAQSARAWGPMGVSAVPHGNLRPSRPPSSERVPLCVASEPGPRPVSDGLPFPHTFSFAVFCRRAARRGQPPAMLWARRGQGSQETCAPRVCVVWCQVARVRCPPLAKAAWAVRGRTHARRRSRAFSRFCGQTPLWPPVRALPSGHASLTPNHRALLRNLVLSGPRAPALQDRSADGWIYAAHSQCERI